MRAGAVVADRFEILREAGAGGMSLVFQARDRLNDEMVALKLLDGRDPQNAARFAREGSVLADLRHPGIVRYVAHGVTAAGQRYLAMEWLEGEDLHERLQRAGLTLRGTVILGRRVAEALGFAHARGVVHRDVKPSNLYLPDGQLERVKVLDFGIARVARRMADVTLTGTRVGTPAYMSPEQARGSSDLDARVDVFALGGVLYRCLTGRKAFTAEDPMALIAKILLEEPPRPRELRSDVPVELDDLIMRMLAKRPESRPAGGAEVAAELERLGDVGGSERSEPIRVAPALTIKERRLYSLVLARGGGHDPDEVERVRATVTSFGARVEALADGSLLLALEGVGAATDQAALAARSALAVRALLPRAPIAIATGRGVPASGRLPVGEVIDRAARLLRVGRTGTTDPTLPGSAVARRKIDESTEEVAPGAGPPARRVIRIDEVTAGLLDGRFEVGGGGEEGTDKDGLELIGERAAGAGVRTLLGRPTPCVARDAELASLEAIYGSVIDESAARAVLVTAAPGVGKSRLRHELAERLRRRVPAPEILMGRGDPMSAGAPFGMLAGAIRAAAALYDGEPLETRRRKLRARISRHLGEADGLKVAEFVGELVGVPFPDEASAQLRAARGDPKLLGDRMRRAFEEWLAAELAAQPVLIVLEDLHWGDLPSVSFVDGALRMARDRPLMVLALARPDVHDLFPRLWGDRRLQEIRLNELSRRSSERLVRQVLGAAAAPETVARIVERSGGNAFYLEELIRAAAEGYSAMPETVLAMVQARLENMEPEARQLLRAASIFGEIFWQGGVRALLGGEDRTRQVRDWLAELCAREVIFERGDGKFPGQKEYGFRHALVREAAYDMLTDADRTLGHRLAAEWLAEAGESEPVVLAQHFERGGEPEHAVGWYRRAAEQALGGDDLASALERAERGVACGASGGELGALRAIEAEVHAWRGANVDADGCALEAMRWMAPGSDTWCGAVSTAILAEARLGRIDALVERALALPPLNADSTPAQLKAAALTAEKLLQVGRSELAEAIYVALEQVRAAQTLEPEVQATIDGALAWRVLYAGDSARAFELEVRAAEGFERAGDLRQAYRKRASAACELMLLGAYVPAETALRGVLAASERLGLETVAAVTQLNLGFVLARRGVLDEAAALGRAALSRYLDQGDYRLVGASRLYLSLTHSLAGELEAAEREARLAVAQLETFPPFQPFALAVLAEVRRQRGDLPEARRLAEAALGALESLGEVEEGEVTIRLVHAEVLKDAGEHASARAAIERARQRLVERSSRVSDAELRRSFLERVHENARTLELAARWAD